MIGYPFDSHVTFDSDGSPIYDRAISSIPERTLFKQFFTTGVLMKESTNLQVVEKSGMTVTVKSGFALIEGCRKYEEADRTLVLQAASSTYDRIDTVVMRLNDNDDVRACDLYIVQGTPASNPVRPALTRTASVYEIGLADIFVQKNATTISANKITDTRLEAERCGIVSAVSKIDTTTLFNQYHQDFVNWFDSIRDILDESTAGHLQNEIDALTQRASSLESRATSAESSILTLEGKFDDSPVTFSPASTISLTKITSTRSGNAVIMSGELKFSSAASGWNNVGTINGKRPTINTAGSAFNNTYASRTPQGVLATTSGVLYIIGNFNANDILEFSISYKTT